MAGAYGAGKVYDALMRSRARSLSNAIRSEALASMAQPGYRHGGPAGIGPSIVTPTAYPPLMLAPPQEHYAN